MTDNNALASHTLFIPSFTSFPVHRRPSLSVPIQYNLLGYLTTWHILVTNFGTWSASFTWRESLVSPRFGTTVPFTCPDASAPAPAPVSSKYPMSCTKFLQEIMCPRRKSGSFLMEPTEEDTQNDMVFNNCLNPPMFSEDGLSTFPGSMIADPRLDHNPLYQDSPDRAVAFNQQLYPIDCSYPMHDDYQLIHSFACGPQAVFQAGLGTTNHAGFSSNFDGDISVTFDESSAISVITSFPKSEWNFLPNFLPANPARRFPCTACHNAFQWKKDLKRHIGTVHATGEALVYRCRCGKGDIRKDNHRRHVRTCNKKRHDLCYICKCLSTYMDEAEYLDHVASCPAPAPARQ